MILKRHQKDILGVTGYFDMLAYGKFNDGLMLNDD